MHEMSLAEGVLQILEDSARTGEFSRVRTVRLEIGRLSSVEPDAMRFCFDAVARGSIAEGAQLEIVEIPGTAQCFACGRTVEIVALYDPCPACGGYGMSAVGGTEMKVRELEVE